MSQIYDNLEEGSEEYKKLFLETKEKLPDLEEETFCAFIKAKKYFSKFKMVDDLPYDSVDLSKTDLKTYTEAENQENVMKAMERLYGDDNSKKPKSNESDTSN